MRKRWLAAAHRAGDGRYEVAGPLPAGQTDDFFSGLRKLAPNGPILAGFDFPIGVPRRYAELAGVQRFPDELVHFGEGLWADFYSPTENKDQISLRRPFYPRVPGGTKRQDLVDRLGLQSADELLRACDHSPAVKGVGCPIFLDLSSPGLKS